MTSSLYREGVKLSPPQATEVANDQGFPKDLVACLSARRARRRRETSRCVARTADVSGMCPHVFRADKEKCQFAGALPKPSDGLEPSTPSLPFRFRGGKRGHARVTRDHESPAS